MSGEDLGEWAIELLIDEAWSFYGQSRYAEMLPVAEKARGGARRLGSLRLEIRATEVEAEALRVLGDMRTALARISWILAVAQDPARRAEIERAGVEVQVASAYLNWVATARFLPEIEAEKLLAVLDAGEAYVRGVGKPGWRAGLLQERAQVLGNLGRWEAAIAAAEEGLALKERTPDAPGADLASHRWALGDLLLQANRHDDASRRYEAVLADDRSSPHGRRIAHAGLARCVLATGRLEEARRHADDAVSLAEGMGDESLQPALDVLINACLAQPDLPAARAAAARMLEGARRLGSGYRLYFALRAAAKVALAENDAPRARALLAEAQPYAEALDRSRTGTSFTDELARYRAKADALLVPPSEDEPPSSL